MSFVLLIIRVSNNKVLQFQNLSIFLNRKNSFFEFLSNSKVILHQIQIIASSLDYNKTQPIQHNKSQNKNPSFEHLYLMNNFKGLLPRSLITDQGSSILNKRSQQFKRITHQSTQIASSLLKIYQIYLHQMPKMMNLLSIDTVTKTPTYDSILKNTYLQIYKQLQKFSLDYLQTPVAQITSSNTMKFVNYSNNILAFQKKLKNYHICQISVLECAKKYFKSQKILLNSMENYKQSFTDPKLIYNMDEKIKRYSVCQMNYKNTAQDHGNVMQIKQKLQAQKAQVLSNYELLQKQQNNLGNEIDYKIYCFLSKFNQHICQNIRNRVLVCKQGRKNMQESAINTFFKGYNFQQDINNYQQQSTISSTTNQNQNDLEGRNRRKAGNLELSIGMKKRESSEINSQYLKRLTVKLQKYIQNKKSQQLRMFEFHLQFYRSAQKKIIVQLKQCLTNLQKAKKKTKQLFSSQTNNILKQTLQIIKLSTDCYAQVQKKTGVKINVLGQVMQQIKNILKTLMIQVHQITDKIDPKEDKQSNTSNHQQKIAYVNILIASSDSKLKIIEQNMKQIYTDIITIYENSLIQLEQKIKQLIDPNINNLIQNGNNIKNRKIDRSKKNNFSQFSSQNNNNDQNQGKIIFQDDIQKNNQFKKLKKPVQITILTKNISNNSKEQGDNQQCMADDNQEKGNSPTKVKIKHKQFLEQRITYVEGEELIRTFSCAMADKIILQGRLYVTNQRLCFYSNFNPNTVFFGETFIQIPKKDIIALQKRKNGIFFDNSISITTVKGQVFLTSFIKRNQAFMLISQIAGINRQNQAYQQDQNAVESDNSQIVQKSIMQLSKIQQQSMIKPEQKQEQQNKILQEQDDIKQSQIQSRAQSIQKLLNQTSYPYKQSARGQFNIAGLTAYKLLQIHLLQPESQASWLTISGNKYANFLQYYKKNVQMHKDRTSTSFTPALKQHLNKNNIKQTCPQKSTRHLTATVPTPPSNIPFVPKFTKTSQKQSLYIISKHKWVLDNQVQSSGAPYTDSFRVYYRTVCESNQKSCNIVAKMYIHFLKNVMVKGVIQAKTTQESALQIKKEYDQLRKFLIQHLKPKKTKQIPLPLLVSQKSLPQNLLNSASGQQKLNAQPQQIFEQQQNQQQNKIQKLQEQIEQLKAKNDKITHQSSGKLKKYQLLLIISLIINVIFAVVVIF